MNKKSNNPIEGIFAHLVTRPLSAFVTFAKGVSRNHSNQVRPSLFARYQKRRCFVLVSLAIALVTLKAFSHGHSTTCHTAPNGGFCHVPQTLVWREIRELPVSERKRPDYDGKDLTDLTIECSTALNKARSTQKPWVILHDSPWEASRALLALQSMPPGSLVAQNWSSSPEHGIESLWRTAKKVTIIYDFPLNREEAETIHGTEDIAKVTHLDDELKSLKELRDNDLKLLERRGVRLVDGHEYNRRTKNFTVHDGVKQFLETESEGLVIIIGHNNISRGVNEDGSPRFRASLRFHDGSELDLAEIRESKPTLAVLSCSAKRWIPRDTVVGKAIFALSRSLSYSEAVKIAQRFLRNWSPDSEKSVAGIFSDYQLQYVVPAAKDILERLADIEDKSIDDSLDSPSETSTPTPTAKPENEVPATILVQIDSSFIVERFLPA